MCQTSGQRYELFMVLSPAVFMAAYSNCRLAMLQVDQRPRRTYFGAHGAQHPAAIYTGPVPLLRVLCCGRWRTRYSWPVMLFLGCNTQHEETLQFLCSIGNAMALSCPTWSWDFATLVDWLKQSRPLCLGIKQVCQCFPDLLAPGWDVLC